MRHVDLVKRLEALEERVQGQADSPLALLTPEERRDMERKRRELAKRRLAELEAGQSKQNAGMHAPAEKPQQRMDVAKGEAHQPTKPQKTQAGEGARYVTGGERRHYQFTPDIPSDQRIK